MPRKARENIIAPGTLYHIVARGNNERRIFRDIRDYRKLLIIIKKTKEKFPFFLYTFNFIPNHYHMEIETQDVPISKIMHNINFLYASYFHYRYKTSGHLFQDRFYSSLIDKESYFWEVARYIDLNSVRAGLAEKPENYRWSSYPIYYQKEYKGELIKLIDRDRFLEYGGDDLKKSRLIYLEFVNDGFKSKKEPKFPKFPINKKMI